MPVYENFISYRRQETLNEARAIHDGLNRQGLATFCDVFSLPSGYFEEDIKQAIAGCTNFLLILTPQSLARAAEAEDWLFKEVTWALDCRKNVVCVFVGDVAFPPDLPSRLDPLRALNGVPYEPVYFESFLDRLTSKFLLGSGTILESAESDFEVDGATLVRYTGRAQRVTVPGRVVALGPRVFENHTEMESIVLPLGLELIGEGAFERCIGLDAVILPESLRRIGARAFYRCYSLAFVGLNDRLQSIEREAFGYCDSLRRIHLNRELASVDPTAFNDCSKLADITVDEGNPTFAVTSGLLLSSDGRRLIRCPENPSTTVVVVPTSVEHLGPWSFAGCSRLSQVDIPSGVRTIGAFAFKDCHGLDGLTLPSSVGDIEQSAFAGWVPRQRLVASPQAPAQVHAVVDAVAARAAVPPANPAEARSYCLVKTTFESQQEAEQMAGALLDVGLIASGQIGSVRSMYWWDGSKQYETEFELTCFTTQDLYPQVERFVRDRHSYEVCEIVSVPILNTSAPFGAWISEHATG